MTRTNLIDRRLIRLKCHQKRSLASHTPARVVGVDKRTRPYRCPQLVVGILARRSASWLIAPWLFHPGQRSENNGNPPYRNAHPIVERIHASPHPVRAGPVLVSRNFRVLATHSPRTTGTGIPAPGNLRTPNRRYVGYVGNTHSLIIESASTSTGSVTSSYGN